MTGLPSVNHTLSLSARLASLEADVAELNELRRQRAELDSRITTGEDAERLLAAAEFILLPLLNGDVPKTVQVAEVAPAEAFVVQPIPTEPLLQEVQEPDKGEGERQEPDVQEPLPANPADDLDEEEQQEPEEESAAPYQLSASAQVRGWVKALPLGQQFAAQDCADATGLAVGTIKIQLRKLIEQAFIEVIDGTGFPGTPSKYVRPFQEQTSSPTGDSTPPLPPIPAKLSIDECSLFDVLRRVPDGLGMRPLGARLNWGNSRVERTLQSLVKWGYVGRNDDLYRVIPEELREGAAAD